MSGQEMSLHVVSRRRWRSTEERRRVTTRVGLVHLTSATVLYEQERRLFTLP
jgi:hypothetical protein